jgi:hypothetical protein
MVGFSDGFVERLGPAAMALGPTSLGALEALGAGLERVGVGGATRVRVVRRVAGALVVMGEDVRACARLVGDLLADGGGPLDVEGIVGVESFNLAGEERLAPSLRRSDAPLREAWRTLGATTDSGAGAAMLGGVRACVAARLGELVAELDEGRGAA